MEMQVRCQSGGDKVLAGEELRVLISKKAR